MNLLRGRGEIGIEIVRPPEIGEGSHDHLRSHLQGGRDPSGLSRGKSHIGWTQDTGPRAKGSKGVKRIEPTGKPTKHQGGKIVTQSAKGGDRCPLSPAAVVVARRRRPAAAPQGDRGVRWVAAKEAPLSIEN